MNASIRSKVAAVTVALVASAGFASSSMATASAEPDGQRAVEMQSDGTSFHFFPSPSDQPPMATLASADSGSVQVGTAGDTRYVLTDGEVIWGDAGPQANLASADSGSVQVGTAGDTRYVLTDGEVIWGYAGPQATFALDRMAPATEVPADGGPVYVGMAGNIKYIVTSNEVIWGAVSPGTTV